MRHHRGSLLTPQSSTEQQRLAVPEEAQPSKRERLVSLDAFRGATMALMVLVNDPGDGGSSYGPLKHSAWNGWTITDAVFPSFLWIVGVAITLSMANRLAAGISKSKLFAQIARRAVVLYALGLLIYVYPAFNLSTERVLGVLQRIAICYLIASAIYLTTSWRGQLVWIAGLLSSYWLMMKLIPVPHYGAGHLDVERNFAHYVDAMVLGRHNYAGKTWDPEGIVSTLPAIATTLFGIMAGHLLRLKRTLSERVTWLFFAGNVLIAAGLICDIWLPINKKLWTSSFSMFMAGLDFVLLAIFVWLIDGQGYKRPVKPLVIMGMNAIAVYMASEILAEVLDAIHWNSGAGLVSVHDWIFHHVFAPIASPMNASLLYAVIYTLLMFGLAYGMYRRGWFLKV
jgi:predicted acyltransferase